MRQKLTFVLGLLLGAALVRFLARQRRFSRPGTTDPRTEELRRKLAERREAPPPNAPPPPAAPVLPPSPPTVGEPPRSGEARDLDTERMRIYEEGRAAVDEMRRSGEPRDSPSER